MIRSVLHSLLAIDQKNHNNFLRYPLILTKTWQGIKNTINMNQKKDHGHPNKKENPKTNH